MTREQTLAWLMQLAESAAEELKEAVANEALMEKISAESASMSDDELDASLRACGIEPTEMLERFQQIRQRTSGTILSLRRKQAKAER